MLDCTRRRFLGRFLVLAAGAVAAGARPGFAQESIRWIDVHAHPIGGPKADYAGAIEAAAGIMDENNIATMLLMPPPQVAGANRPTPFDYGDFLDALKPHGSRFRFLGGGGGLNGILQDAGHEPAIGERLRARFEQEAAAILKAGAVGFGEISIHHLSLLARHPYESVAADHPLLLRLADIAAGNGVPIDVHFDPVVADMAAPDWLETPPNPTAFKPNMAAFERLLAHDRNAKIVWAHAGSDMLGHWTPDLSRRMLTAHPNLFMSLRLGPGRARANFPLLPNGEIKPPWRTLFQEFPDRFVVGNDQFFVGQGATGGPAATFAQRAGNLRNNTNRFLAALPPDIARKIASENAKRIYRL